MFYLGLRKKVKGSTFNVSSIYVVLLQIKIEWIESNLLYTSSDHRLLIASTLLTAFN